MADKKITDLTLIAAVTDAINFACDNGIQTYRNTALQLKNYILAAGSVDDSMTDFTAPTIQKFTSGSGTYTTPVGVKYIRVRMIGGGAGGSGSGSGGGTAATNGSNSTFGSSLLGAYGGVKALLSAPGGAGGSASLGVGPVGIAMDGNCGHYIGLQIGQTTGSSLAGGNGGGGFFGGSGYGGALGATGSAGKANSGSGGGGGGGANIANMYSGSGGGAGGFLDALISSPDSTYAYTVGAGGTAGTAGTNGQGGGAGGSGLIIVEEFYQ